MIACLSIVILTLFLYTHYYFEKNCHVITVKTNQTIAYEQKLKKIQQKNINNIKYSPYLEENEYRNLHTESKEEKASEENREQYIEKEGIINILLVGSDKEVPYESGRSDAIIILTLDKIHKKIKLTSIMRDTYVQIQGYGEEKINHSYAYGGIDLLIKTIEENFNIKLDKYVTSDFGGFKDLVDAVGGVEISLSSEEADVINNSVQPEERSKSHPFNNVGTQHLNGEQALVYARIRNVGNGCYERTERQRRVISLIIDKFKNETSVFKMPKVLTKVMSYVKTNMDIRELLEYAYDGYKIYNHNIQQLQIPTNKLSHGGIYKDKGWVLLIDKKQNIKAMHNFIFNDIEYDEAEYKNFSDFK